MAEKISTLTLKVDLDCGPCYRKIRKILCKLQDQERIRTISYDDGSNTIMVAGPFDPHKLSCKIRCKGGKVIKGIEIVQHNGSGEPTPKTAWPPLMKSCKNKQKVEPKEPSRSPPVHEPQPPPPPPAQPAPAVNHISSVMQPTIEEKKPGENPVELDLPLGSLLPAPPPVEKERLKPTTRPVSPVDVKPPTVKIPSWPAQPQPMGPAGLCSCSCCQPCYEGYYEGCRCCRCGRVYGYAVGVMPTSIVCYAREGYKSGCQLFSEEDPASACTVM